MCYVVQRLCSVREQKLVGDALASERGVVGAWAGVEDQDVVGCLLCWKVGFDVMFWQFVSGFCGRCVSCFGVLCVKNIRFNKK